MVSRESPFPKLTRLFLSFEAKLVVLLCNVAKAIAVVSRVFILLCWPSVLVEAVVEEP